MEITSFYFLCFFAALLALYYLVPKKGQWVLLLAASLVYYWFAGSGWLILYPAAATAVTFASTAAMERAEKAGRQGLRTAAVLADVLFLIGVLALLKYLKFGTQQADGTVRALAVPLGLSYYTFTLAGYAIDVYNGIAERQRNPAVRSRVQRRKRAVHGSRRPRKSLQIRKTRRTLKTRGSLIIRRSRRSLQMNRRRR